MSRPVHWSETALEHLADIARHIARTSPLYAERMVDRLVARTEALRDLPELGRAVPEADEQTIRELIEQPYRLIYFVQESRIDVLAVIHSRREIEWPSQP
ncbi:MAG: type II toxin-antitoxin system RelE/ParE family toxin [Gemmatimonadaceae bacterium]